MKATFSAEKATAKQIDFLKKMMKKVYSDAQIVEFLSVNTTKAEISDAIQAMIDAGYGDRPAEEKSKKSEKATAKQTMVIRRLIASGAWHDSDEGQGFAAPSDAELSKMTKRRASQLIASMKG